MNRILTVLAVGVFGAVVFIACGGDAKKPPTDPSGAGSATEMPSTPSTETGAAPTGTTAPTTAPT
jgi:hypothetical protein